MLSDLATTNREKRVIELTEVMAAARGGSGNGRKVEDRGRPRHGPPAGGGAPLTYLSVPMRVGGKARKGGEWWRDFGR